MRKFLVFLCATTSLGEQFSLESASNQLRDHVSQLVLNGGTRGSGMATVQKNMVDRLLSQMGTTLDEDAKKILDQIRGLLSDLLQDLRDDKDEKQTLLNNAYAAFNDVVDSALRTTFDNNMLNYPIHHSAHSVCRCEQVPIVADTTTKCQTFELFMRAAFTDTAPICTHNYDENTNAGLDSYKVALISGKTMFDTAKTNYPGKHDDCESALTTSEAKAIQCDGLKLALEEFECTSKSQRETMCNNEQTEYNRFKGDFDTLKTQIEPLSTQRVTDARMIKYLDCLVDKLRTLDNPVLADMETACEGVKTENLDADYANTFQDFPAKEDCPEFTAPLEPFSDHYTVSTMNGHCPTDPITEVFLTGINFDKNDRVQCA